MKRIINTFVAVVMSVLLSVIPLISVSASAKDVTVPRIWIHGFMNSKVYDDVSDPNSALSWPPTEEEITNAVKESVPAFTELAVTRNWERFGNEMGKITGKLFSRAMNNPDGTVKVGSGIRFEYPERS